MKNSLKLLKKKDIQETINCLKAAADNSHIPYESNGARQISLVMKTFVKSFMSYGITYGEMLIITMKH